MQKTLKQALITFLTDVLAYVSGNEAITETASANDTPTPESTAGAEPPKPRGRPRKEAAPAVAETVNTTETATNTEAATTTVAETPAPAEPEVKGMTVAEMRSIIAPIVEIGPKEAQWVKDQLATFDGAKSLSELPAKHHAAFVKLMNDKLATLM